MITIGQKIMVAHSNDEFSFIIRGTVAKDNLWSTVVTDNTTINATAIIVFSSGVELNMVGVVISLFGG